MPKMLHLDKVGFSLANNVVLRAIVLIWHQGGMTSRFGSFAVNGLDRIVYRPGGGFAGKQRDSGRRERPLSDTAAAVRSQAIVYDAR